MTIDKVYKAIQSSQARCVGLNCDLWFTGATWEPTAKTLNTHKKKITYPDGKPTNIVIVATNDYLLTTNDQNLVDLTSPLQSAPGQDWRLVLSENLFKPACDSAEANNP